MRAAPEPGQLNLFSSYAEENPTGGVPGPQRGEESPPARPKELARSPAAPRRRSTDEIAEVAFVAPLLAFPVVLLAPVVGVLATVALYAALVFAPIVWFAIPRAAIAAWKTRVSLAAAYRSGSTPRRRARGRRLAKSVSWKAGSPR